MKPIEVTDEPIEIVEAPNKRGRRFVENPSTVENPVAFVHEFLRTNARRRLSRNEAVNELKALGVNELTARTQYQRWFKARKEKSAARKMKSAARKANGDSTSATA